VRNLAAQFDDQNRSFVLIGATDSSGYPSLALRAFDTLGAGLMSLRRVYWVGLQTKPFRLGGSLYALVCRYRIGAVDEQGTVVWGDQLMLIYAREILTRLTRALREPQLQRNWLDLITFGIDGAQRAGATLTGANARCLSLAEVAHARRIYCRRPHIGDFAHAGGSTLDCLALSCVDGLRLYALLQGALILVKFLASLLVGPHLIKDLVALFELRRKFIF
jgi:hypothetical protein